MPEFNCDHCGLLVNAPDSGTVYDAGIACASCATNLRICICGVYTFNRRARCENCRETGGTSPITGQPHPALNNSTRLVGVEIEFIPGDSGDDIDLHNLGVIKGDGSVYDDDRGDGLEFASRPASGTAFINLVSTATRRMLEDDCFVNETCGLHLHLDMSSSTEEGRTNVQNWWRIYEPIFFGLVSSRRRSNEFCNWVESRPLREWRSARYHALNIAAYHEHSTYELRLHHGTLNAKEIIGFAGTALSFFDWAERQPVEPSIIDEIRTDTSRKFTRRFLKSIGTPYTINKHLIKTLRSHRPNLLRDDTESI